MTDAGQHGRFLASPTGPGYLLPCGRNTVTWPPGARQLGLTMTETDVVNRLNARDVNYHKIAAGRLKNLADVEQLRAAHPADSDSGLCRDVTDSNRTDPHRSA